MIMWNGLGLNYNCFDEFGLDLYVGTAQASCREKWNLIYLRGVI